MRIGLVSSVVPHVDGGYRTIVTSTAGALERAGHSVETVWLPWSGDPKRQLAQLLAYRMIDFAPWFDRIVTFRPPAHVVRHPRKVAWFIHHERAYYDLWGTEYGGIPDTALARAERDALRGADTVALSEAERVLTNSHRVRERLLEFNGIGAEVLYPPLPDAQAFGCGAFGDELLYVSRVERHKRQHLALEAMRHVKTPVRLRICGASQNPDYLASLHAVVHEAGLADRVAIDHRWIGEDEKVALMAGALAAVYLPVDEDSYGYPTLEAAASGRPTVTTTDAGGVLEFVRHDESGLVAQPEPRALAAAFDRLWTDRGSARRLGESARSRIATLGISWERVVGELTR